MLLKALELRNNDIIMQLDSENILRQRYGVIAAARVFHERPEPLFYAKKLDTIEIKKFAKDFIYIESDQ